MTSPKKRPVAKRARAKAKRRVSESTAAEFERLIREAPRERYILSLYITGHTPRSARAIANIRSLCDELLAGRYELQVIDIYQQPAEASGHQIIAAPTLIKQRPFPERRMVGDLADRDRVLIGLDLDGRNTAWLKV